MKLGIALSVVVKLIEGEGVIITDFRLFNNNAQSIEYFVNDALTMDYEVKD